MLSLVRIINIIVGDDHYHSVHNQLYVVASQYSILFVHRWSSEDAVCDSAASADAAPRSSEGVSACPTHHPLPDLPPGWGHWEHHLGTADFGQLQLWK